MPNKIILTFKSVIDRSPADPSMFYPALVCGWYGSKYVEYIAENMTGAQRREILIRNPDDEYLHQPHYSLIKDPNPFRRRLKRAIWAGLEYMPENIIAAHKRVHISYPRVRYENQEDALVASFNDSNNLYMNLVLYELNKSKCYANNVNVWKKKLLSENASVFGEVEFHVAHTNANGTMPHSPYIKILGYQGPYYYQPPGKYLGYNQKNSEYSLLMVSLYSS